MGVLRSKKYWSSYQLTMLIRPYNITNKVNDFKTIMKTIEIHIKIDGYISQN